MSYAINDDIIEQRLRQRCNTTCCKSGMHPSNVSHHVGAGHGVKVYTKGSGISSSTMNKVQTMESVMPTSSILVKRPVRPARSVSPQARIGRAPGESRRETGSEDVKMAWGSGRPVQKLIKKVSDERKMGLKDVIQHVQTNGLYKKKGSGAVFGKPNKVQPAPPEPGPGDGPYYHKSDVYADTVLRTTREIPNVLADIIGNYADDERDARNELGSNRIAKSYHDTNDRWNRYGDALNNNSRPAIKFTDTKRGKQADSREKYIKHKYPHLN